MKTKKIITNGFFILLIIISAFIFSLTNHLKDHFNSTYLEQLLYNLFNTTTLKLDSLNHSIKLIVLFTIIISGVLLLILLLKFKNKIKIYSISVLIISIIAISLQTGLPIFIIHRISKTNLYDKYYVKYKKDNIIFSSKRNLIYIYIESLENTNFTTKNGGLLKSSYMPKLEKLTQKHINFSNNNKIGGFKSLNGTDWTIAAMVSQSSGVPIIIKTNNKNNKFLEGASSLGDILLDNGYSNYLLIGSDANFGERRQYFTEHGKYAIYDYDYAKNNRDIPYNYHEWWGYEDKKLFEIAKKKLLTISEKNKPFNFTMLTADTHFFDGYVDKNCPKKFSNHYANSYYCEDIMLNEFINWIQEQSFYKNTTIVIAGDHMVMRNDFYKNKKDYTRTVYNLFINPINTKEINTNNRDFTAFDMLPTTLASIGANIKNDRLALGTNLFSNKKTISEKIGYNKLKQEIAKESNYYNKNILKK